MDGIGIGGRRAADFCQRRFHGHRRNQLLGHHAGRDQRQGHPAGEPAVAQRAVAGHRDEVGVAGAGDVRKIGVVGIAVVSVGEGQGEGSVLGAAIVNLGEIRFDARGGAAGAAFAAAEVGGEIAGLQRQRGGDAVQRDADARRVRSAENVEPEPLAETVHRVISF